MDKFSFNIDTLFNKMESLITTKTVVGDAINFGNVIIVPLIDVSFGVGVGAAGEDANNANIKDSAEDKESAKSKKENKSSGGVGVAGGLGGKITPSAVLVIVDGNVTLVNIKNQDSINKLIDLAPGLISKLSSLFNKKDSKDEDTKSKGAVPLG